METIFEKDFYPTPVEVIERMLAAHDVTDKIVLEPSAGSGNIVEWLQQNGAKEVIACEKNEKLRRIVAGKCRVVADDFLTLRSEDVSHIDMIVMNPPFSDARRHILHAYEIAPGGCEIVSLCNSSDVVDRFCMTEDKKKVKELVDEYGYSEDYQNCFSTSERKTDVYVSCIHLYKPKNGADEFDGYLFDGGEDIDLGGGKDGLIKYDVIRDVVARYVEAVKRYDEVMELSNRMNELTSLFRERYGNHIMFGAHYTGERNGNNGKITRQRYKVDLQKDAWRYLIGKLNLRKYSTMKLNEQINKFVETQVHVPFTMKNVYRMIYLIVGTAGSRMDTAIVEAFENICGYSADNSTAGEKWKTNLNYMVNKRFVVPYMTSYDARWPRDYVSLDCGRNESRMNDVITALAFLTGKQPEVDLFHFIRTTRPEWGKWYSCGSFFRFRAYKKGTMHFEFEDEKVWEMFNRRVAEIKGWRVGSRRKGA